MDPQTEQPANPQPTQPTTSATAADLGMNLPKGPGAPAAEVPASDPDASPWEKLVGHIARWEDGTSWFVLRDGRHWIPDGETYAKLQATGAKVFDLPAAVLDTIPDIKGSHISVTGK